MIVWCVESDYFDKPTEPDASPYYYFASKKEARVAAQTCADQGETAVLWRYDLPKLFKCDITLMLNGGVPYDKRVEVATYTPVTD